MLKRKNLSPGFIHLAMGGMSGGVTYTFPDEQLPLSFGSPIYAARRVQDSDRLPDAYSERFAAGQFSPTPEANTLRFVTASRYIFMKTTFQRRMSFAMSERWSGWFCERCCWNRPQPHSEAERKLLAGKVQAEFDAHDCDEFSRLHKPGSPPGQSMREPA